jgi:hypothetical protein
MYNVKLTGGEKKRRKDVVIGKKCFEPGYARRRSMAELSQDCLCCGAARVLLQLRQKQMSVLCSMDAINC